MVSLQEVEQISETGSLALQSEYLTTTLHSLNHKIDFYNSPYLGKRSQTPLKF